MSKSGQKFLKDAEDAELRARSIDEIWEAAISECQKIGLAVGRDSSALVEKIRNLKDAVYSVLANLDSQSTNHVLTRPGSPTLQSYLAEALASAVRLTIDELALLEHNAWTEDEAFSHPNDEDCEEGY